MSDFTKARGERGDEDRSTWEEVDLGPYLSGKKVSPPPTVGRRNDGPCLFYRGKVNGIHGESESAKTWICLAAAAAEMIAGEHVLYLDYEDGPEGVVERLLALGVPPAVIGERFHYVNPDEKITAEFLARMVDRARGCSVVVIDATTEAMTVEGLRDKEGTEVAEFHKRLSRPLAKAGAAVLVIDHVVKDEGQRHLGPTGSQHKRAGITGTSIYVECIVRMARGKRGRSRLYVSKDRPGHVREAANRTDSGRDHWGDFTADATDPQALIVELWPAWEEEDGSKDKPRKRTEEDVCQLIWDAIPTMKSPPTTNNLYDRVKGNKDLFRQALARMVDGDHVLTGPGSRGSTLYTRGPTPWPPREDEFDPSDLIA